MPPPGNNSCATALEQCPVAISSYAITCNGLHRTGVVELHQPNPSGWRRLKIDYRRPRSWSDEHEAAILRIAILWFARIGKLGCLRAAVGKHIHAALQRGSSERFVCAAINAYADSPWHREHGVRTTIERFFMTSRLDEWIEKSPEFAAHVEQQQQADRDAARRETNDRLAAINIARHRAGGMGGAPPHSGVGDATTPPQPDALHGIIRGENRETINEAQRQRQQRCQELWDSLPVGRRERILARARQIAKVRGWDQPHDMTNAQFRIAVFTYVEQHERQHALT